jgi:hypothetical protein
MRRQHRGRWLSAGLAAAMIALALPATAAADETKGSVDFAVFGASDLEVGQEFTLENLRDRYGVDPALVDTYAKNTEDPIEDGEPAKPEVPMKEVTPDKEGVAADDGTTGLAAAAAPDPRYALVASWQAANRRTVNLRRGDSAWGLTKIEQKHNLNVAAVRTTTKYPAPGFPQKLSSSKDTWNYQTLVNHVQCSGWWLWRKCKVVEKTNVLAGVDFAGPKGVITAFCVGIQGRCPDWVKNAANAR